MTNETTFPALLERLYAEQFSGPVVIQFGQGVPHIVEFPQPAKTVRLDKAPVQPDTCVTR